MQVFFGIQKVYLQHGFIERGHMYSKIQEKLLLLCMGLIIVDKTGIYVKQVTVEGSTW